VPRVLVHRTGKDEPHIHRHLGFPQHFLLLRQFGPTDLWQHQWHAAKRDRVVNITVHFNEWLLGAGIGGVLAVLALVGIGLYVPAWAVWAAGLGLTLMGMLFAGLGIWLLVVIKSVLAKEHGTACQLGNATANATDVRVFLTYDRYRQSSVPKTPMSRLP
jgi:hypothetical protein